MVPSVGKVLTKIFGSRNERLLKRYHLIVDRINALEPDIQKLTDAELRTRTAEIRAGLKTKKLRGSDVLPEAFGIIRESMDRNIGIRAVFDPENHFNPDLLDDPKKFGGADMLEAYDAVQRQMIATGESWQKVEITPQLYDAVRTLYPESRPPFRARCFDVQLIGGLVLYEGRIAEMATGEGKTFVGPLACFMRVLEGFHAHVVTVNDYLVRRDASWVRPAFEALGMTVGFIQSDMDPGGDARRAQYGCDITYGTNSEFGFDYLRDNMKERVELQVQGPLDFAIVDEVDSILIDEARTPLIISGAAHDDAEKYRKADFVARAVIDKNKPWANVEKQIDSAKRSIKGAEGDEEKAKGDKKQIEAARKRRADAQKAMEEAEAAKADLVQYIEVELDRKQAHLTHDGIAEAQDAAGVGSFYVGNNMEWPHLMEQSLRAHLCYERDKEYVVEKQTDPRFSDIVIVDEYTGRKMQGRQWSDGLHQAVEAKERVSIKQETQTLATITLQNFFKLYRALSGMTGTAQTEAEEFNKIYKLDVVSIPTNRPVARADNEDRVYRTEKEKWEAIIDEIKAFSDAGRPVLVGTTSVEKSEMLSKMLTRKYGIRHNVLNAKQHEREAHIVAEAGLQVEGPHGNKVGQVTVATNMAGRGTDIKLAPETLFEVVERAKPGKGKNAHPVGKYVIVQQKTATRIEFPAIEGEGDEAGPHSLTAVYQVEGGGKLVGGLHVIGTERHTARRIDNQLRGRGGRQGDPGSSRFYVSLQDELMKMFAGDWVIRVLGWLGMEEGMAIEDKRISKGILRAQKKVEERNFLARKNLLDYDDVMDKQRTTFYGMRQQVLEGRAVDDVIWSMIGDAIDDAVDKYVVKDYVATVVSQWAAENFQVQIDAYDLRGMRDFDDLEKYVKAQARAEAETTITSTLGEYTGDDDSEATTWDAKGLASWAMSRFQVQLSQAQIRKMSFEELAEKLRQAAIDQIDRRDAEGLRKYLVPQFAEGELAGWARDKFDIEIDPAEFLIEGQSRQAKPASEINALIEGRARAAYSRREIEYPADHILAAAFGEAETADNPYTAEYVRDWINRKYRADYTLEQIRATPVRKLRDELVALQRTRLEPQSLGSEVDALMRAHPDKPALAAAFNERYGERFSLRLTADDLDEDASARKADDARQRGEEPAPALGVRELLLKRVRAFYRWELTELEQFVLIQIFDNSWKDHLYAMDMLKSGIAFVGFAERDPRIAYKKEGFQFFEEMMAGVRDKATDLIFRARVIGQTQARSAYHETEAVHEDAGGYGVAENLAATASALGDEPQEGGGGGEGPATKVKQIVNAVPKVGRNDPCPCGSGKKYKKCCGASAA